MPRAALHPVAYPCDQPSRAARVRSPRRLATRVGAAKSPPASAHAIIIDSAPKQGEQVKAGPEKALLTFNTRLEEKGCRLALLLPDGSRRPLDVSLPTENQIGADLGPLTAGNYRLDWIALSVDGHLTRGRIAFTVAA